LFRSRSDSMKTLGGKIFGLMIGLLAPIFLALPAAAEIINLEVQSSSVERDKTTNEVVVTIELSPDARTAFENFTQRNVGRNIEVRIGTMVLLKAKLVEKITGGTIRANTKFNDDEGKKVAAQLTRGTLITLEELAE
jgi:preprotein translocase subunit SecD